MRREGHAHRHARRAPPHAQTLLQDADPLAEVLLREDLVVVFGVVNLGSWVGGAGGM